MQPTFDHPIDPERAFPSDLRAAAPRICAVSAPATRATDSALGWLTPHPVTSVT
jgi:hypothetical protein